MSRSHKRKPRRRLRKSIKEFLQVSLFMFGIMLLSSTGVMLAYANGVDNIETLGVPQNSTLNICEEDVEPLEPIVIKEVVTVEEKIKAACDKYDVPYDIVISIARLETGWFKSQAYLEGNNPGGMSINEVPIVYNTLDDGVDAFVSNLAENYFALGLDTPEEIGRKYCPINPEWSNVVSQLVEELNGTN